MMSSRSRPAADHARTLAMPSAFKHKSESDRGESTEGTKEQAERRRRRRRKEKEKQTYRDSHDGDISAKGLRTAQHHTDRGRAHVTEQQRRRRKKEK